MARNRHKINGLTIRQEQFCIEFAKSGDAYKSYELAGYDATKRNVALSACARLLKKPEINARLAELRQEVARSAIADIAEIQERLTAMLRQEAEEEVLMTEGVEKGVTETVRYKKKADLRVAAKAAELLAKMSGAFSDGSQVNVGVQVIVADDIKE